MANMKNDISELLAELARSTFYGAVELKYEAGVIVLIRKTETFKPTEPTHGSDRSASHDRNFCR